MQDIVDGKRILREIRILRHLNHENIIQLTDLHYDQENIYIITQFMDVDLHKVIVSMQELTDEHIQYIIYQILRGVKYIHSANIVHRDLKPSNLLATESCEISICDFGLSRQINSNPQGQEGQIDQNMTEYVVTRHYRAPEIMLSSHEYSTAVDIWSIGCILAELLTRKVVFNANNYMDQIRLILEKLGKPSEEDLNFITNQNARQFINQLPDKPQTSTKSFINYQNEKALDLLDKMLTINPSKRYNAVQCLQHPYLENLHEESDEPIFEGSIDFSFENNSSLGMQEMHNIILQEIQKPVEDRQKDIQQEFNQGDQQQQYQQEIQQTVYQQQANQ
ncbi:Protein kinase-like domain [Pseudocohnilembus persalinus]|uniref:Protein kinase-like domain n=1 Tax=Pseudocohnilembus persalinus TaxID=266149 RepID=A0A0V0QGF8_PSEPJ|nr:Protein kinase-like domain [Pseudocohnilembus persalinus]|eukprot:KRX01275.1 Protein kinase-like domain [Pseudocohnilembus persalinus]